MEAMRGFPLTTSLRLSAAPAAWDGKLFLSDEDCVVHVIDSSGVQSIWTQRFTAALRSPASFLTANKRQYAAVYPKSFFGEIWLLDTAGNTLPGWPAPVPGIGFGAPLLFAVPSSDAKTEQVFAAFITQAGELSVFDEEAALIPGFPLDLESVFYLQPVWDGEALALISDNGTLFRVSLDGEILRQIIPNLSVREEGFIGAVTINGNKTPDIFFSGEGNALYGYSRNFNSLDGFPVPVWGKPSFADLNGDGKIELSGAGLDNRLYRWHFR
jgi:hypothetical protein